MILRSILNMLSLTGDTSREKRWRQTDAHTSGDMIWGGNIMVVIGDNYVICFVLDYVL